MKENPLLSIEEIQNMSDLEISREMDKCKKAIENCQKEQRISTKVKLKEKFDKLCNELTEKQEALSNEWIKRELAVV